MASRLFIVLLMILTVTSFSFSQSRFTKKGQLEVSGSLSYSNVTDVTGGKASSGSMSYLFILPSVQYFAANGFEIGGAVELMSISPSSGDGITDYTFYLIPTYNFKTNSEFFPYVQGQIGYTATSSNNTTISGLAWALETGVKMNFMGNGLIKFGFNYKQLTKNNDNSSSRNGMNIFSAAVGIGLFF
ncbi:MAG: hypothetical protein PHN88_01950 [Ignavibacteria bacterium]|nr:hypothetical protein [Ignavibacteria bacterium]